MASLGNLDFGIKFLFNEKELADIKAKALKQLEDLEVKINFKGLSKEDIQKEIQAALDSKEYQADITVNKEKLSSDVKASVADAANSAAVEKEVQSYANLESAINGIIGTRAQNIKRLAEEKDALASVQSQLRLYEQQKKNGISLSKAELVSKAQLINREMEHKQAIAELSQLVKADIKVKQASINSMDGMSKSLGRMKTAYRQLTEAERQSPFGKDLLKQIDITDTQIKKLDASIGNHQRNVGNYASGWNGLQHEINQFARELPALAYGPNVFFSAISNNLPMMIDQVKRAKVEYKSLIALQKLGQEQDKKAVPVWLQLVKGITSWQTALIIGLTLLTKFGRQITDLIFKTDSATKAYDNFLKSLKEGNGAFVDAVKEITRLESLLRNIDGTYITTKDALNEYNNSLGKSIGATDDLGTAQQNIIDKKEAYLDVILQQSIANEYLAETAKLAAKEEALRMEETFKWYEKLWAILNLKPGEETKQFSQWVKWGGWNQAMMNKNQEKADDLAKKQEKSRQKYLVASKKASEMAASAGIDLLNGGDDSGNKVLENRIKLLQEAYNLYKEMAAYVGESKAISMVQDYTMADFDPTTYREQIQAVIDDINSSPELKAEAKSILFNFDKGDMDSQLKETENYIKQTVASWDLFKDLYKKSGNMGFALNATFGTENVSYNGVLDQLKKNIQYEIDKSGALIEADDLFHLSDTEIEKEFGKAIAVSVRSFRDESNKMSEESLRRAAELLSTYKNYEQQRKDVIAQGEQDVADLMINGSSQEAIDEAVKRMNESLASLDFKEFKESDTWAKAFGDIGRLSTKAIDEAIAKIEEFVGGAGKDLPITELKELMTAFKKMVGQKESRNPLRSLIEGFKDLADADGDTEKTAEAIDKIKDAAMNAEPYLNSISGALGGLQSMFSALGNEGMSEAMGYAQEAINSVSNIGQGFAKGGIVGGIGAAVGEAAKWVGILANQHDAKLDKAIQKSEAEVRKLESAYQAIEQSLSRALGNQAKLTKEQKKNLEMQLKELEIQRKAEAAKKKADKNKLADYDAAIKEAREQLQYFAEDAAADLLNIDFKDWASQLGDALFEAWKKGEDGAEAFRKTSADILAGVMNDILKMSILQPMMNDVKNTLFGSDGKSGYFGSDYSLDEREMKGLADILMEGEKKSDAYYKALGSLNEYMDKNYGINLKEKDAKSGGLSAGISSIKEDQADILASLANGMRADIAGQSEFIRKFVESIAPETNMIAENQLKELRTIAKNTGLTADHTNKSSTATNEIIDLLNSVVSGTKALKMK